MRASTRLAVPAALQALAEAARRPHDGETLALVRHSLAHRSNHVGGPMP